TVVHPNTGGARLVRWLQCLDQQPQQLSAQQPALHQQVLGVGVRTAAIGSQAVERRDADRRGEVAVAGTAGAGLAQGKASLGREALRELRQPNDAGAALHRWTVDATADAQLGS